jgi:hypothetical protein
MSISAVARESLPAATTMTWATFLAAQPPEVVLGAFTGAIIFLLSQTNKTKRMWLLLFSLALVAGLIGGPLIASCGSAVLAFFGLKSVVFPPGLGAMISAACTVTIVSWLRDNPTFFLRKGLKESS